ncbi:hypothetical protein [Legionella cardiaca]|uniref:Uncharacterized protein n=1 Tax=Legionella cardiaca TaxID=1071983 RepID=A0ABY8ANQ3_9GAMM|nr:hypothetical protein [Legionella cardiaca]WED42188.1 hypothetical protein PXX05_09625 [Legionella cardiaca]
MPKKNTENNTFFYKKPDIISTKRETLKIPGTEEVYDQNNRLIGVISRQLPEFIPLSRVTDLNTSDFEQEEDLHYLYGMS